MASVNTENRTSMERVVEVSRRLLDLERRPVPRDQHPKQHGCVRAKFVINEGLADSLKEGLFNQEGKVYDAWIRFSNGAQRDDRRPDVHGMAIKIMGVEGPKAVRVKADEPDEFTQDFVMVDHPTFFLKDATEYALFSAAVLKARGKAPSGIRNLLSHLLPERACSLITLMLLYFLPWRIRTLARLMAFASKRIANPLRTRYWSTTAYKFGASYMKFSAVPIALRGDRQSPPPSDCSDQVLRDFLKQAAESQGSREPGDGGSRESAASEGSPAAEDYLQAAMAQTLTPTGGTGGVFLFQVQRSNDSSRTPIDDPRVEWLNSDAEFHTVARIWIPPQKFQTEKRNAFGENLSMTPWHALAAHAPVGEINEIRRLVYERLADERHEANGVKRKEPRASDPDPDTPEAQLGVAWGNDPSAFTKVLFEELELIKKRRLALESGQPIATVPKSDPEPSWGGDEDKGTRQLRLDALRSHVTGLAFSGGGIRSGTFAVGFLQGLASLGLIRRFDYLSTVSGGGYAGAWLAAWLRREGGDPANVERMLAPSRVTQASATRQFLGGDEVVDEEPEPLRHLRSHSSYLFPHPGILSADTWTVILIWLRNVTINLMMLFPAIMLLVVIVRLGVALYRAFNPLTIETARSYLAVSLFTLLLGAVAGFVAFLNNSRALRCIRDRVKRDPAMRSIGGPGEVQSLVASGVTNPMTVAALLLTVAARTMFWAGGDFIATHRQAPARLDAISIQSIIQDAILSHMGLLEWPTFLGTALLVGGLMAWGGWLNARKDPDPIRRGRFVQASFIAGATGGVLFVLLAGLIRGLARIESPDLMATFAAPLALLVVVASLIVLVALLGRTIDETEREWWARLSALGTLRALTWIGVMATILYVPGLLIASGPWVRTAVASGWLGTAVFGVLTGRYIVPKTEGRRAVSLTTLASVASSVFLVGLVGLVSLLASVLANTPSLLAASSEDLSPFGYYILGVNGASTLILIIIGAVAAILYALARNLIDVNLFSLNAMYANRLTRCYLGASRAMSTWPSRWRLPRDLRADAGAPAVSNSNVSIREPNPVTGFDPVGDDIEFSRLRIGDPDPGKREYLGPHLLINTTLNLVGESSLSRRDRKGESFILSPLYCGSKSVGYAKLQASTEESNVEPNLTLGRAIAISGAAVDPNMSFYQSASLTALLTLFNARLGYWIENPRTIGWTAKSPKLGNLILTEFFGRTNERGEFVHISDGGHFENLGVYELIRRRCRYIVVLDAGEDGDPSNDNLATLVRLCRIDFGIRVKIDTRPLEMEGPDRLTRSHVVIGAIHYEDVDQGELPGVLVYVKISLTGDESPDIQRYARTDTRFPHQPTDLRQSFDEEQFECYRCLGDHIAWDVFGDAARELAEDLRDENRVAEKLPHQEYIPRLFAAVQQRWSEAPEALSEAYVETNLAWSEIQRDLSKINDLQALSQDLYPELSLTGSGNGGPPTRAELHTVARMLALMENSWIALALKRTSALPMNRGWVNSFRRWAGTNAFRRAWPILRSEYSGEFVRFCEEQLHLIAAKPSPVRLSSTYEKLPEGDPNKQAIEILDGEFAREWPSEHREHRGIIELINKAEISQEGPMIWLLAQSPSGPKKAEDSPDRFACGVILAVRSEVPSNLATQCEGQLEPVELFIWVRRAYRSAGLGCNGLQGTLESIREELKMDNRTPPLWSRYPKAQVDDDELEFANFVRFLSRFNFRPLKDPGSQNCDCSILLLSGSKR